MASIAIDFTHCLSGTDVPLTNAEIDDFQMDVRGYANTFAKTHEPQLPPIAVKVHYKTLRLEEFPPEKRAAGVYMELGFSMQYDAKDDQATLTEIFDAVKKYSSERIKVPKSPQERAMKNAISVTLYYGKTANLEEIPESEIKKLKELMVQKITTLAHSTFPNANLTGIAFFLQPQPDQGHSLTITALGPYFDAILPPIIKTMGERVSELFREALQEIIDSYTPSEDAPDGYLFTTPGIPDDAPIGRDDTDFASMHLGT